MEMGGLGSKAFYIDTNQDFSPYRLKGKNLILII